MSKNLSLYTRLATVLLIVFLIQTISNFAQTTTPNIDEMLKKLPPEVRKLLKDVPPDQLQTMMVPKGKVVFEAISPEKFSTVTGSFRGAVAVLPFDPTKTSGAAVMISRMGNCGDDKNLFVTEYWVLLLNGKNQQNLIITNQKDKTAGIRLSGTMRHWRLNCQEKRYRELPSGIGGMRADFSTAIHSTPRGFQVYAGREDVQRDKYLNDVKRARRFMLEALPEYYKSIGEYQKKPKFDVIDLSKYNKLPPGDIPPAPAGAIADDNSAVIWGEGLGNAVRALDMIGTPRKPSDVLEKLGEYGAQFNAQAFSSLVQTVAVSEATSSIDRHIIENELPSILSDPVEHLFDMGVANMVASVAAVNKMYADNGDPQAQAIQQEASKPSKFQKRDFQYVDADYMASLALDAFDAEIKRLEKERELEQNLPPTSARGFIWGPGLYEDLRVNAEQVGMPVAISVAKVENQTASNQSLMDALRKAGYPVPDMNAVNEKLKANIDGLTFDLDAAEPNLSGELNGKKMLTAVRLPEGSSPKVPELKVQFSVGSPNGTYSPVVLGTTIFEPPFTDEDDDEKQKCNYFVATTGSDTNPGTTTAPFATVQTALDKAKICRDKKQETLVTIKNGTYRQSANVTWTDTQQSPSLTISGESADGVIFSATEISNATWETSASGFSANMPLHPEQPAWTPTPNFSRNPPPVVVINGQRLRYIPIAKNLPVPGSYKITDNIVNVRPQTGISDLKSATVEVGVRPFAIKMAGARNVTISNMIFQYFEMSGSGGTPGVVKTGSQINLEGVNFK